MAYLVGTDEAGYGPNLGPLVISATVWRVDSLEERNLFERLRDAVCATQDDASDGDKLPIGDSKALYKPGKGLQGLERGVLTCLATVNKHPRTWRSIWDTLSADREGSVSRLPWYRDFDASLPVDIDAVQIEEQANRLAKQCRIAGCGPTHMESRAVFPAEFNSMVEQRGNKAAALSHVTLDLVKSILDTIPENEPVHVLCDKHGGRNKYGPLLNETFPDSLAVVRAEGRLESAYQLGHGARRREFVFRAKGESFLPSALASMVSKYLRELAMQAFNQFWTSVVNDLKPTAGYPVDAKRFKTQIEPTQRKLGIDDHILWRCR